MKSKEFKKEEKQLKHSLDIMLKNYKDNPQREDLYKRLTLDKIRNLIDNYIELGYDVNEQLMKYQRHNLGLEW